MTAVKAVKMDYVAAAIRQQMEALNNLNQELEKESLDKEALQWRLRSIEIQLRRLREAA
jgi:hypothetical protein